MTDRVEQLDQEIAVIGAEIADVERCLGEARRLYKSNPGHYKQQINGFALRLRLLHERLAALDEERHR